MVTNVHSGGMCLCGAMASAACAPLAATHKSRADLIHHYNAATHRSRRPWRECVIGAFAAAVGVHGGSVGSVPLQQQPFAKGLGVPVSEVMQYTDSTPLP